MVMSFSLLFERAGNAPKKRLAVAAAADDDVLQAVAMAQEKGYVDAVLVGDEARIKETAQKFGIDLSKARIVDEKTPIDSAKRAVALVRGGEADFLMKGQLQTSDILRAVLDKENGLRGKGLLSHVAFIDSPALGRPIFMSDGGMNIAPDLMQKADIIRNAVAAARGLGIETPKVAVLAAVELVNPDMPATLDAAALVQMNRRGQIKDCIVDGPLGTDNAISEEAAKHKGIKSECAGAADILIVPDIEAGNMLTKAAQYLGGCSMAGVIMGAKVPIVLTSRADTAAAKLASIAWAAMLV